MKKRNLQKRNLLALLLALALLALPLAGCGGSANYASGGSTAAQSAPMEAKSASMTMDGYAAGAGEYGWAAEMPEAEEYYDEDVSYQSSGSASNVPVNVKMIYTADISLESTEFDAAVAGLEKLVADCGGWFESSMTDNSRTYRTGYYTVRVPAENFFSFCDRIGSLCQVNSLRRSAQDVSEYYYDTESRLATQKTKLARLQELLAQAEDMADIITLESAISDTEYQIEQLTGTLRKYDSLVGYSTVEINLREVYKLTEVEEPVIGFGAKLAAAFRSGTRSFLDWGEDFLLGFAEGWAGWLLFIIIVVCGIIFLPKLFRGRAARRERRRARREEKRAAKARAREEKRRARTGSADEGSQRQEIPAFPQEAEEKKDT